MNNNSVLNKNKSYEKKYNEKDLNLIFEDTHSDYLNEQFYDLFRYLKPNSSILQNVNQSDVIDFFYDYFDIESSVKTTKNIMMIIIIIVLTKNIISLIF